MNNSDRMGSMPKKNRFESLPLMPWGRSEDLTRPIPSKRNSSTTSDTSNIDITRHRQSLRASPQFFGSTGSSRFY